MQVKMPLSAAERQARRRAKLKENPKMFEEYKKRNAQHVMAF